MKAAFYYGIGDLRVEEVPVPGIGDHEMLVRILGCAVCGTDGRIYRSGHFKIPPGVKRTLGHEISAEIAEVGAAVHSFRPGDRVAVAPNVGCGSCFMCIQGFNQLCPTYEAFGISMDGGFAEYMKIPSAALRNVAQIPDAVSSEHAVLIEPLSCVCNAFDAYRTRPGDTVVVIGAGPIGALHVLVSKLAGGRVIAADVSESRLRGMEKYGADLLVPSASVDLKAEVDRFTGGRGADVIITACSVPAVQSLALHLAAPRGRVSLFGGLPAGKEEVPLNTNLIHYKELCVTATTGSRMQDLHSAIKLLASGLLDVSGLITARFPLEETAAAFDYAATGAGLKAVVIPGLTAGARDGRRPA